MTKACAWPVLAVVAAMSWCLPAAASTIPGADDTRTLLGGGLGSGLGLSLDGTISGPARLGFSLGTGRLFQTPDFDLRFAYRLPTGAPRFDLALMAGAYGSGSPTPVGVEAGAALAYAFTPKLDGRVNLVFAFPFGQTGGGLGIGQLWAAPAAGFELGYHFTPLIEGTLGFNGRGEILGMRLGLS